MKIMGWFYREYFVSKGLLAGTGCDAVMKQVFVRADTAQRTRVTAQALAESILPGCAVQIHSAGEGARDTLFDGAGRPDPEVSLAAVAGRLGPKPEAVIEAHREAFDTLAGLLNGNGKAAHSIFEEPDR